VSDPAVTVRLDRLGMPGPSSGAPSTVYAAGIGEGSRARIEAAGVDRIVTEREDLADADLVGHLHPPGTRRAGQRPARGPGALREPGGRPGAHRR